MILVMTLKKMKMRSKKKRRMNRKTRELLLHMTYLIKRDHKRTITLNLISKRRRKMNRKKRMKKRKIKKS